MHDAKSMLFVTFKFWLWNYCLKDIKSKIALSFDKKPIFIENPYLRWMFDNPRGRKQIRSVHNVSQSDVQSGQSQINDLASIIRSFWPLYSWMDGRCFGKYFPWNGDVRNRGVEVGRPWRTHGSGMDRKYEYGPGRLQKVMLDERRNYTYVILDELCFWNGHFGKGEPGDGWTMWYGFHGSQVLGMETAQGYVLSWITEVGFILSYSFEYTKTSLSDVHFHLHSTGFPSMMNRLIISTRCLTGSYLHVWVKSRLTNSSFHFPSFIYSIRCWDFWEPC